MKVYPVLTTTRLTLTNLKVADIPKIVEYAGNKKVAQNTLNMPHPYFEKDAIFWLNMAHEGFRTQSKYIFGIRLNTTNELIGGMGLHLNQSFNRAELGYWIGEPFWNKGYASEAAAAILKFGFEVLKINKIFATHLIENPASGKVMIKNGMVQEGTLKDHVKKGDNYQTLHQYRLTKKEYEQLNKPIAKSAS